MRAALSVAVFIALAILGRLFPSHVTAFAMCAGLVSLWYYLVSCPRYRAARKAKRWHAALLRDRELMQKARVIVLYEERFISAGKGPSLRDDGISVVTWDMGIRPEHLRRARAEYAALRKAGAL